MTAARAGARRLLRLVVHGRIWGLACAMLLAGLSAWWAASPLRAAPVDEVRVHGAYLINFIRYSRWPEADAPGPRVVAVLGPPAAAAVFRQLAQQAGPVNGHPVVVRTLPFNSAAPERAAAIRAMREATDGAHVVYIAPSHRSWEQALVAATAGRPVLTVGTGADFISAGGMFAMFTEQGRVRFAANIAAVRGSAVDVSGRVLLLARPLPGAGAEP